MSYTCVRSEMKINSIPQEEQRLLRNRRRKHDVPHPALIWTAVVFAIVIATIGLGLSLMSCDTPGCGHDEEGDNVESRRFKSAAGRYRFAAVASDAKQCSRLGTEIMARYHGNAADSAVATMICNGAVNAHSVGLGGGALFVVYNRTTRQALAFNAREMAPAAANATMYVANNTLSKFGGLAVGVPGELLGLWTLHQRYGRLPWAGLLQPTIQLCERGFPLTRAQHNGAMAQFDDIKDNPEFSYLLDSAGQLQPPGHKLFRLKLARTLRTVAKEGADAFYTGSLADDVVADITDNGGIITKEDLKNYFVDVRDPVTFNLTSTNLTMYGMPLPGSGLVSAYILNILSGYKFSPESVSSLPKSVLTHHRIVEAMKFAYARRSKLGDDRFLNITELITNMTSPEVGEEIRQLINDTMTQDTAYYGCSYDVTQTAGTAHLAVIDSWGNVVSSTSSINLKFGSKVKGSRTGIIFNSQMDDFSTPNTTNYFGVPASPSNFIAPGKRPMSSMSPTIVVDRQTGEAQMVVGAAGGTTIPTTVALIMMKTLWFNETVTNAVDDPRLHHQLLPKGLEVEENFPQSIRSGLVDKGHSISTHPVAVVHAIHRTPDKRLEAVSDFRKGGEPDGF